MITRRAFLGTAAAVTSFPAAVFGQTNGGPMKFRMTFSDHTMTATLFDNPSAQELLGMLPLELKVEDYSTNEKIAYLPRKLMQVKDAPFSDERPGDIAYYAPWGNLVFYYDSYRYSKGLIRLGRFERGFGPLLTRGEFPLRIKAA
jgi:hypothetical protein